jgi:hypothetical protein
VLLLNASCGLNLQEGQQQLGPAVVALQAAWTLAFQGLGETGWGVPGRSAGRHYTGTTIILLPLLNQPPWQSEQAGCAACLYGGVRWFKQRWHLVVTWSSDGHAIQSSAN